MAINVVSVQYDGGLLDAMILLTHHDTVDPMLLPPLAGEPDLMLSRVFFVFAAYDTT